jgi:hypothetical protein
VLQLDTAVECSLASYWTVNAACSSEIKPQLVITHCVDLHIE